MPCGEDNTDIVYGNFLNIDCDALVMMFVCSLKFYKKERELNKNNKLQINPREMFEMTNMGKIAENRCTNTK